MEKKKLSRKEIFTMIPKRILSVVLVASMVLTFTSCEKVIGEGPVVTEARNVDGFKRVSVSVSGKVNYRIDPVYKVEVMAQQNILNILETNKVGDELVIKFENGKRVKANEDILITISAPFLTGVNLSGSAEFTQVNAVSGDNLDLRVSGSGNINISQVDVNDKLTGNVSGSGNIVIQNGSGKNTGLKISGSGNINAGNFVAEKATADISGSGNVQLYATQTLDASISGSGSIFYRGNPLITTHVSGSGKVKPF